MFCECFSSFLSLCWYCGAVFLSALNALSGRLKKCCLSCAWWNLEPELRGLGFWLKINPEGHHMLLGALFGELPRQLLNTSGPQEFCIQQRHLSENTPTFYTKLLLNSPGVLQHLLKHPRGRTNGMVEKTRSESDHPAVQRSQNHLLGTAEQHRVWRRVQRP